MNIQETINMAESLKQSSVEISNRLDEAMYQLRGKYPHYAHAEFHAVYVRAKNLSDAAQLISTQLREQRPSE